MKATITWILVADGTRARIFLNEGPGKGLKTAIPDEFTKDVPPNRDIVTDRPGSNAATAGPRHGYAPRVDWRQFEKHRFASGMADVLNKAAKRKAFDRLVLVAPPQPLGSLRAKLDGDTRDRVYREIGKDLTNVRERDLPARLEGDNLVL